MVGGWVVDPNSPVFDPVDESIMVTIEHLTNVYRFRQSYAANSMNVMGVYGHGAPSTPSGEVSHKISSQNEKGKKPK